MSTDPVPLLGERRSIDARALMTIDIDFHPVPVYETPVGTRMNFAVASGKAQGPGFEAGLLPGSADWLLIGVDRVARVDVRATLLTDDGAHVYMTNSGRVSLDEHIDRFLTGETVTASEAYIRTVPLFETSSERYTALNTMATVAFCDISLTHIHYDIYALD